VSQYQKGKTKTNLDFLEQEIVSGRGIGWGICKSAPHPRQITMPAPHHSVFLQAGCPSCHPTNSVEALKEQNKTTSDYQQYKPSIGSLGIFQIYRLKSSEPDSTYCNNNPIMQYFTTTLQLISLYSTKEQFRNCTQFKNCTNKAVIMTAEQTKYNF